MRALLPIAIVGLLGIALSGCVAYDVVSTGVGVATTVVSTTVGVAGSVAKGAASTVSGDSDDDDDSDHQHHHHGDSDDGDK